MGTNVPDNCIFVTNMVTKEEALSRAGEPFSHLHPSQVTPDQWNAIALGLLKDADTGIVGHVFRNQVRMALRTAISQESGR